MMLAVLGNERTGAPAYWRHWSPGTASGRWSSFVGISAGASQAQSCYCDAGLRRHRSVGRLFKELHAELGDTPYIVAVDDGSISRPLEASSISEAGLRWRGRQAQTQRWASVAPIAVGIN